MTGSGPRDIPNRNCFEVAFDDLTPMMQEYVRAKRQHPQALLLYRVGDFYETFFQDACTVSEVLELTLTSKDAGKKVGRVPMAGVPHHALDRYAAQLVNRGYAVAIGDQTEDPAQAQGLVRREVTRVLTPGTVIEAGMLAARRNNFLAAAVVAGKSWGLAHGDVSTGEVWTTQGETLEQLTQELLRLQPSEVLTPVDAPDLVGLLRPGESRDRLNQRGGSISEALPDEFCYALRPASAFGLDEARQRLMHRFRVRSLEGLGCDRLPLAIRAAGGLLEYIQDTFKGGSDGSAVEGDRVPLQTLKTYTITDYLILDHQTRRNLEIVQTVRDGLLHGSLLWSLDKTVTSMGSRALRRWLLQPLLDAKGIEARQNTVAEIIGDTQLRRDLQANLRDIYDLERLAGRAGSGTANARELMALADSLHKLPDLAQLVAQCRSPYLKAVQQVPETLEKLGMRLKSFLKTDLPISVTEGDLIRDGVSAELDELRSRAVDDRNWLAALEQRERERLQLSSLKLRFNKTFGYYIGIPRAKADLVPDDYIRKQTLTNEERYITPELKEREARILSAQDETNLLEYEIFCQLRNEAGLLADPIRQTARAIAAVDVLICFAEVAVLRGYCCPEMTGDRTLNIKQGRHPVVEYSLPDGFFVPNSTVLGSAGSSALNGAANGDHRNGVSASHKHPDLVILTGPNASGKSCYLRQVGLIQLMAQVGSYVPAQSATLGISDRIFTRVGAVDDLATGQSTFMVEMNETANILNHATERSLVLLDEIGRGTATFDGLSIAWAVAEYLANDLRTRAIFATHYHELNELAALIPTVANFQVTVQEQGDRIVFLHQVQPGGADKSYGIEAARLAGLPKKAINRARQVMTQIEKHSRIATGLRKTSNGKSNGKGKVNNGGRSSSDADSGQEQLDMLNLF
ncbi:MAG: DNA mismatch repair protein MutS [Cyanobacteria bacterium P01_D01_bin.73]